MRTPIRIAAAGALALALAACGEKSKPDPYLQNIPDSAALTIDTAAAAPAATLAGVLADPVPVTTVGDDLGVVHDRAQAMNAGLRAVFAHLETLAATDGTLLPGSVKQWGPRDVCVETESAGTACVARATVRLRVIRFTDHIAAFKLAARATTSTLESDFRPVLAGYLIRGAMDRRGAGRVWVNLQNLKTAAGALYRGEGFLAAGFAAGPIAKTVTYRMLGFTRDLDRHAPITGAFAAWKNAAGVVRARVAGLGATSGPGDLYYPAGQPSERELGLWHAVWAPTLGGRAFTVISDYWDPQAATTVGDVPAGKYWFARACYPAGATEPSYKEWFLCDRAADGPPAACVLNAPLVADSDGRMSHQGTPDTNVGTFGYTHWSETSCWWNATLRGAEPDELLPPSLEPRDVNDDRGEDRDHTGLVPEGCPTTVDASNPDPTPPGMGGGGGGMMGGLL